MVQQLKIPLMQNINKRFCFLFILHITIIYFVLLECFYFHFPCSIVFLNSFLNRKQIKVKIKIHEILSYNFFKSEIGKWGGDNQYQFQVLGEC